SLPTLTIGMIHGTGPLRAKISKRTPSYAAKVVLKTWCLGKFVLSASCANTLMSDARSISLSQKWCLLPQT
ncbi:MAG: hypothetical protein M0T70_16060, partial [Geobacteraceae bacterium]|nr:hypothetical protein [Geobacteraceae bacterium]